MIKPSCSKARQLVLESEGGRIDSADALWLESHVQECKSCREESRELTTLFGAWKSLAPPQLSTGRLERIEQAVLEADVTPATRHRSARTWKVPTIAAGIAATMAVVSLTMFYSKRHTATQPPPTGGWATSTGAPPQHPATITHGKLQVYGPTGDVRVFRGASSAPWNTSLHASGRAGCVLSLGPHVTLGLAAGARVALRHHGTDTVVTLTRGTMALDVRTTGTQRTGQIRVWIPGRGEVATQDARLVVAHGATGLAVSTLRGWTRYRWTQGGTPQAAELDPGDRLTHRLDTVRRDTAPPEVDAGALLAGRSASPAPSRRHPGGTTAPQKPSHHGALASRTPCAVKDIRHSLSRRNAMKAVRTLEACRAAGQSSQALRALEAQANLQAGRVRRALTQYLAVAHSFQGSPTGQTALYSAGRIALNRLARKSQAKHLFKHYLHTYPNGAHRANVQQMLRTL